MHSENKASIQVTDKLLDTKQASDVVCLSERTLQQMRQRGNGPQFIKISSRCVRYRLSDLMSWIAARTRVSTSGGLNGNA